MQNTRLGQTDLDVSKVALGTWPVGGEWGSVRSGRGPGHHPSGARTGCDTLRHRPGVRLRHRRTVTASARSPGRSAVKTWSSPPREACGGTAPSWSAIPVPAGSGSAWSRASATWVRTTSTSTRCIGPIRTRRPRRPPPCWRTWCDEGKVRHVGVSNYGVKQMDKLARFGRVETLQPAVPHVPPGHRGRDPPLRRGEPPGRASVWSARPRPAVWAHDADDDLSVRRLAQPQFRLRRGHLRPEPRGASDASRGIAAGLGLPLPQLAVAWTTSHPGVDVAILGRPPTGTARSRASGRRRGAHRGRATCSGASYSPTRSGWPVRHPKECRAVPAGSSRREKVGHPMSKITFLGLGLMGTQMSRRLIEAGNDVTVWNRTAERTVPLARLGAEVAGTPGAAVQGAEFVVTMLARPEAVEDVLFWALDGVASVPRRRGWCGSTCRPSVPTSSAPSPTASPARSPPSMPRSVAACPKPPRVGCRSTGGT